MKYMLGNQELRIENAGPQSHGKKVLYVFTNIYSSKGNQEFVQENLQELIGMAREQEAYGLLITCDESSHFDAEINVETGELLLGDFDDPCYDHY